jgi:hypothetical protein
MNLRDLMQRAGIWRAGELPAMAAQPTGFQVLDEALPGGGWPQAGMTEILSQTTGIGALRLVLPALARLSQLGRWIIWVSPPHVPYSPALLAQGLDLSRLLIVDLPNESQPARHDILWAYEQALRFSDCGAALLWLEDATPLHLRRLQLAAEIGRTWALVFRPARFALQSSPALLRLGLAAVPAAAADGLGLPQTEIEVTLLKARGAHYGARYRVVL